MPLAFRDGTSATPSGAALRITCLFKECTYPELLRAQRCRLVVLAIKVAGRWSSEAVEFVRLFARSRARSAPAHVRGSCASACAQRWSGILAFAAARAFAAPRELWTFPTSRGQPAVSFGLRLRTGTAWIGLKKGRKNKSKTRQSSKKQEMNG